MDDVFNTTYEKLPCTNSRAVYCIRPFSGVAINKMLEPLKKNFGGRICVIVYKDDEQEMLNMRQTFWLFEPYPLNAVVFSLTFLPKN